VIFIVQIKDPWPKNGKPIATSTAAKLKDGVATPHPVFSSANLTKPLTNA
jgi:hypothetical protein